MVTKERLAQLRAGQLTPAPQLECTIGGAIETEVHAMHDSESKRELTLGELAFKDAQRSMRIEQAISSHEGLSKTHFNYPSQEIKQ